MPVARGATHAALVVPKDGDAPTDQKASIGKQVLAILGLRSMHENDSRMFRASVGADQRPRQLNVAVRETHVFTFLAFDPSRDTRSGPVAPPSQGDDLPGAIALKLNSRLDRSRDCGARTGQELVAIRRIQRPN